MTTSEKGSAAMKTYRRILAVHERTLKYLATLGVDPELLHGYGRVLTYLHRRPEDEVRKILGTETNVRSRTAVDRGSELPDASIEQMTLDEVHRQIMTATVSRRTLERIAHIRFGVSKGALSALRSRAALMEKLATLIGHEGTHDSIARAVRTEQGSS